MEEDGRCTELELICHSASYLLMKGICNHLNLDRCVTGIEGIVLLLPALLSPFQKQIARVRSKEFTSPTCAAPTLVAHAEEMGALIERTQEVLNHAICTVALGFMKTFHRVHSFLFCST